MMYQALYRKYRPKKLDEIAGQDIVVKILKNAIRKDKISHAYLFCGPRGTGKTSIAKILAKTINCEHLNDFIPCDNCASCVQINNKNSNDIIEIDAASNNGVDEIRELKNKINLVPNTSKYKVYIIDEVHMLTIGAFNALLKTLEEPPKHAIFILATTEPHKIPITILSRCQRLDFKKISQIDVVNRLKTICSQENIEIDEDALIQIAKLCDGGMRDSIGMLDKLVSYCDDKITINDVNDINGIVTHDELKSFIKMIISKNYKNIFEFVDNLNSKGKNLVKIIDELIEYLRNILVDSVTNLSKNELEISNDELIKYIEQFSDMSNIVKNANNPKIVFETNIIKMTTSENKIYNEKIEIPIIKKEKVKLDVKDTVNKEEAITVSKDKQEMLEKLKNIRINNTLSNFNKKYLIECKEKIDNVKNFIIDPDYSNIAGLILDGNLKAASDKNLIFVFESENVEKEFNLKIPDIEKLLQKIGLQNYMVVAVDQDTWNNIKEEYNSKTKKYNYVNDTQIINMLFKQEQNNDKKNSIENLFNDIIEYDK